MNRVPKQSDTVHMEPHPTSSSSLAALANGQVHLWHNEVSNLLVPHPSWLSAEEESRADRFSLPAPRAQFIAGRIMLRGILGQYLDCDPASLEFSLSVYGKPALKASTGLEFNLSHSGGEVLLALAWQTPVGVDIETWRRLDRLETLAQRCLAPGEYAEFTSLPPASRTRGFFRFWVRKEALAKASGRGVALGMQHCVSSLHGPPRWLDVPPELGAADLWSLAEPSVQEGLSAAATVHTPNARFYWGRAWTDGAAVGFEKLKSLMYSTPDCVLGNAAADLTQYPSR